MSIAPAKLQMAKPFEQAVYDKTAYTAFSARNARFEELDALIAKTVALGLKGANTRSTKDSFYRIKSKMDQLINKLNTDNEIMSTAVFMINTKMASDQKYKDDQTIFRNWIGRSEDALADLIDKLEESGMNIASDHAQEPVSSDISAVLLQISNSRQKCKSKLRPI